MSSRKRFEWYRYWRYHLKTILFGQHASTTSHLATGQVGKSRILKPGEGAVSSERASGHGVIAGVRRPPISSRQPIGAGSSQSRAERFLQWFRNNPREHFGPKARIPDLFQRRDQVYLTLDAHQLQWRPTPPYTYHDLLDAAARVGNVEACIGYTFQNKMIAIEALKMSSESWPLYFKGVVQKVDNNRRLALIGDRILSLALCEIWYHAGNSPGVYTQMVLGTQTRVVLDKKGRALEFDKAILLHRSTPPTLHHTAETVEAILGAVYIDSGHSMRAVKHVLTKTGLDDHELLRTQDEPSKDASEPEGLSPLQLKERHQMKSAISPNRTHVQAHMRTGASETRSQDSVQIDIRPTITSGSEHEGEDAVLGASAKSSSQFHRPYSSTNPATAPQKQAQMEPEGQEKSSSQPYWPHQEIVRPKDYILRSVPLSSNIRSADVSREQASAFDKGKMAHQAPRVSRSPTSTDAQVDNVRTRDKSDTILKTSATKPKPEPVKSKSAQLTQLWVLENLARRRLNLGKLWGRAIKDYSINTRRGKPTDSVPQLYLRHLKKVRMVWLKREKRMKAEANQLQKAIKKADATPEAKTKHEAEHASRLQEPWTPPTHLEQKAQNVGIAAEAGQEAQRVDSDMNDHVADRPEKGVATSPPFDNNPKRSGPKKGLQIALEEMNPTVEESAAKAEPEIFESAMDEFMADMTRDDNASQVEASTEKTIDSIKEPPVLDTGIETSLSSEGVQQEEPFEAPEVKQGDLQQAVSPTPTPTSLVLEAITNPHGEQETAIFNADEQAKTPPVNDTPASGSKAELEQSVESSASKSAEEPPLFKSWKRSRNRKELDMRNIQS